MQLARCRRRAGGDSRRRYGARCMPGRQRAEAVLEVRAHETEHAGGLAVEAAPEGDDLVLLGVRARQSERALDRLGAARVELGAAELAASRSCAVCDAMRSSSSSARLAGEGAGGDAAGLLAERLGQRRMPVAERRHADAGDEVDEAVAVDVVDAARPPAVDARSRRAARCSACPRRDVLTLAARMAWGSRSGDRGLQLREAARPAIARRLGKRVWSDGGGDSVLMARHLRLTRGPGRVGLLVAGLASTGAAFAGGSAPTRGMRGHHVGARHTAVTFENTATMADAR